jgi:hypothetical protein
MNRSFVAAIVIVGPLSSGALADDSGTVYRQLTKDGRVLYSDQVQKGAKLDQTISVIPPVKGNPWSTEAPPKPAAPPKLERTPIDRLSAIPAPGRQKTLDDAQADVIRAEMLLEEARNRQRNGVEPLPGERTGNVGGGSRLNESYADRQRVLAEQLVQAEDFLRRMTAERDALSGKR